MASPTAFDRLLPTRSLFRGRPLVGVLLSATATLCICAVLLCAWMLIDLLATNGFVEDEGKAVLTEAYGVTTPANEEGAEPIVDTPEWALPGENRGLVATVVRMRSGNHFGSGAMTGLVGAVPTLRTNTFALVTLLVWGVVLVVGWAVLRRIALGYSHELAMDTSTRLRRSLHRQALRLGPGDLRDGAGDTALELFSGEVDLVRRGVREWAYRLGRHPVEIALLLLLALCIEPRLTFLCLFPLGGCWYLVHRELQRRDHQRQLDEDRAGDELRRLAEGLRNTRLVRGYAMESFEHEEFSKHLERYQRDMMALESGEATTRWAVRVLVAACLGLVFFLVGLKVLAPGGLAISGAVLLLTVFATMYPALERLTAVFAVRERAVHAAGVIQAYLDELPEVSQAVGARFLEPLAEELRFEGVHYTTLGGQLVLDDFSLSIRSGDVVALLSLDSIEARAAAYLLPRFIEPQRGRVMFDGEDIAWVTLESLRAECIFVGGGDLFFTGTVAENIACGSAEYGSPAITDAAKTTHAHNFITKLPHGYETVLGEHGEELNVGEAFRLGLARAIVRNPAILVVEEPEEALDEDTKAMLDDAYDRILGDRTVILLPTRLSTIRRANRVIVLQNGRIVADGHHSDLVKSSAVYRHWEYVRFNQFERS